MAKLMRGIASRLSVAGELLGFLWSNRKWWLIPMVIMLLVFGLLLVFASATAVGPFIYTLF
jgi:hypothetical protein